MGRGKDGHLDLYQDFKAGKAKVRTHTWAWVGMTQDFSMREGRSLNGWRLVFVRFYLLASS